MNTLYNGGIIFLFLFFCFLFFFIGLARVIEILSDIRFSEWILILCLLLLIYIGALLLWRGYAVVFGRRVRDKRDKRFDFKKNLFFLKQFSTLKLCGACLLLMAVLPMPIVYESKRGVWCALNHAEALRMCEMAAAVGDALDACNVTYYATLGSVLGLYRYDDHIPWEPDIDVCTRFADVQRVLRCAKPALVARGYRFIDEQWPVARWQVQLQEHRNGYYAVDSWNDLNEKCVEMVDLESSSLQKRHVCKAQGGKFKMNFLSDEMNMKLLKRLYGENWIVPVFKKHKNLRCWLYYDGNIL